MSIFAQLLHAFITNHVWQQLYPHTHIFKKTKKTRAQSWPIRGLNWPPSTNQKPGSSDPLQWIPSLPSQAQSVCKFCAKRKLHQGAWQTTIAEMCYDYVGSLSDLIFDNFSVFLVVYCVYCIFSPNLDWIIQILVLDLIRSARHETGPRRYKGKLTNN